MGIRQIYQFYSENSNNESLSGLFNNLLSSTSAPLLLRAKALNGDKRAIDVLYAIAQDRYVPAKIRSSHIKALGAFLSYPEIQELMWDIALKYVIPGDGNYELGEIARKNIVNYARKDEDTRSQLEAFILGRSRRRMDVEATAFILPMAEAGILRLPTIEQFGNPEQSGDEESNKRNLLKDGKEGEVAPQNTATNDNYSKLLASISDSYLQWRVLVERPDNIEKKQNDILKLLQKSKTPEDATYIAYQISRECLACISNSKTREFLSNALEAIEGRAFSRECCMRLIDALFSKHQDDKLLKKILHPHLIGNRNNEEEFFAAAMLSIKHGLASNDYDIAERILDLITSASISPMMRLDIAEHWRKQGFPPDFCKNFIAALGKNNDLLTKQIIIYHLLGPCSKQEQVQEILLDYAQNPDSNHMVTYAAITSLSGVLNQPRVYNVIKGLLKQGANSRYNTEESGKIKEAIAITLYESPQPTYIKDSEIKNWLIDMVRHDITAEKSSETAKTTIAALSALSRYLQDDEPSDIIDLYDEVLKNGDGYAISPSPAALRVLKIATQNLHSSFMRYIAAKYVSSNEISSTLCRDFVHELENWMNDKDIRRAMATRLYKASHGTIIPCVADVINAFARFYSKNKEMLYNPDSRQEYEEISRYIWNILHLATSFYVYSGGTRQDAKHHENTYDGEDNIINDRATNDAVIDAAASFLAPFMNDKSNRLSVIKLFTASFFPPASMNMLFPWIDEQDLDLLVEILDNENRPPEERLRILNIIGSQKPKFDISERILPFVYDADKEIRKRTVSLLVDYIQEDRVLEAIRDAALDMDIEVREKAISILRLTAV